MENKVCTKCGEEKSIDDFYTKTYTQKNGTIFSGHDHRCKTCHYDDRHLRIRLNKGFENLKTDYCECCGDTNVEIMLDHNHSNGNFRGFVCKSCNVNLSNLGDNYESVIKSDCLDIYKNYMKMAQYRQGKGVKL